MKNDNPLVPAGITEPSDDTTIWRYINFEQYLNLLENKRMLLSSPSKFNDKHEGAYANRNIQEVIKRIIESNVSNAEMEISNLCHLHEDAYPFLKSIFISCWHIANSETMYMWQTYAGLNEGVAIQSSYGRLKSILDSRFYIGLIKYYNDEALPINQIFRHFYKLKHYENEKEVRAIYYSQDEFMNHIHGNATVNKLQYEFEIDPTVLIEKIFISPSADNNFQTSVSELASFYNIPVKESCFGIPPKRLRTVLENIKYLLQQYAQHNCPNYKGEGFIMKRSPVTGKFCQSCDIASQWESIKVVLKKQIINYINSAF